MLGNNVFIRNVCDFNSWAHRDALREFLVQERASVVCLVETKIDVVQPCFISDLMGTTFDYVCLPSSGASGGILVAWCRDAWSILAKCAAASLCH